MITASRKRYTPTAALLKRSSGLWQGLNRRGQSTGLWIALHRRADQKPTTAPGLWQNLNQRTDPQQYKPRRMPDVVEEQVLDGDQKQTIIYSPRHIYHSLDALQYDLWQKMDGSRSIQQLAVEIFMQHKRLIAADQFVDAFGNEGFLLDQQSSIYSRIQASLDQRSAEGWGRRIVNMLREHSLRLNNLDQFYAAIYNSVGWLLFTPVFLVLWLAVALAGIAALVMLFMRGAAQGYEVLALNGSVPLGLAALWSVLFLSFVLHESAHALAVKHYKRRVLGGGVMLYYGMPAAFIDTNDMWRSPRQARMHVSAAGPMSDLFVGGTAALLALFTLDQTAGTVWTSIGAIAFKLAVLCLSAVLFNANPLLKLDGYHILSDWLRQTNLREDALSFVRESLVPKLRQRQPFTPEERTLAIFGVLTILYTGFAIAAAFLFWRDQMQYTIGGLLQGLWWEQLIAWLLIIVVVIPILAALLITAWGVLRVTIGWLLRKGYGRRPDLLSLLGLMITIGLGSLSVLYPAQTGWLTPALWVLALVALAALQSDYRGAALAVTLRAMLITTGCSSLAALLRLTTLADMWIVPEALAFLFLTIASFSALIDVNLRDMRSSELLLSVLMMIAAFGAGGLALLTAQSTQASTSWAYPIIVGAPAYLGMVTLAFLVPLLFDMYQSRLFWPWILAWVGIATQTIAYIIDLRTPILVLDTLVAGFWAVGWLAHLASLRQIAPDELRWQYAPSLSESERVSRAFRYVYAGCYRMLRTVYGERRAQAFDDRMDIYAATADWDVKLERDQAKLGGFIQKMPLDAQGARFAEVLRYTVQQIEEIAGAVFARRTIQAAYDALPWPERESASRLCFPDTPWARALSGSFGNIRTARLRLLRQIDRFIMLDDNELEELSHSLDEYRISSGGTIPPAGHKRSGLWIVEHGEVIVQRGSQVLEELHRYALFGDKQDHASVRYRASVESTLLFISNEEYQALMHKHSTQTADSAELLEILRLFERSTLFANTSRTTLRHLAQITQRQEYAERAIIVRQGIASGCFYLVEQGQLAVLARIAGEDGTTRMHKLLSVLGPAEFFGELELLKKQPPFASVVTTQRSVLLAIPHKQLRPVLGEQHALMQILEQVGSGRLLVLQELTSQAVSA